MSAGLALRARAGKYLDDAVRGIEQAPVEVIATFCIALTFSGALELGDPTFRSWAEFAVACVLLLGVAWTGTLLHALGAWTAMRRWVFTLGGAIVIAIYALTVEDFRYESEGWRAALLIAAAVLWLVALPAFGGPAATAVDRMRRIDGRILLRMIAALLYGAALFAGLALALAAIDNLFELNLEEDIYGHVWGWIFFMLVPWIVLGGISDYVRPIEQGNQVAGVAQRIAVYLVPPLLALYALILYAYVVRILITSEIPKNLVSPLVLAAGGLGALALLVFDPRPGGRGLPRWLRVAPPLFLPLVPLGAWALLVRIDQYGWTEFRVVRLLVLGALAALAVAATVQLVRRHAFALHLAPLALGVILLLAAVGPWSALAMARRSQQSRLTAGLAAVDVPLQDTTYAPVAIDTADAAREVPADVYEQIRSSAQYLAGHFRPDALPPVFRRLAADEDGRWRDYAADLGLRPDEPVPGTLVAMGGDLPHNVPLELSGGTAYRIRYLRHGPGPARARAAGAPGGRADVSVVLQDSTRMALHIGDRVLYTDLAPLIGRIQHGPGARRMQPDLPPDRAVLPVVDTAGVMRAQLLVLNLWAESDSTGLRIGSMEGLVVVPRQ